jgi:KDO2-lipid IV(A) lauroyltransferase
MLEGVRVKDYLEYLGILGARRLIAGLPPEAAFSLFRLGAKLVWPLAGRRRRIGEANLRKCFPELSEGERQALLAQSLESIALAVPEFVCQKKLEREAERWTPIEGFEHVAELLKSRRGFFVGTGHFGTWGMLWAVPRLLKPFGIIVKRLENPYVDRMVDRLAEELGCVRIADRSTGEVIVSAVERGLLVGFFMDQAALPHLGKRVNFFGHPAYTHLVPYYLALKHQIPFVPVFGVRLAPGRSKMVIRPPLPAVKTRDKTADLIRMAEAMNRELELMIRSYPGLYMWMHERFKRAEIVWDEKRLMAQMGRVIKDTWDEV